MSFASVLSDMLGPEHPQEKNCTEQHTSEVCTVAMYCQESKVWIVLESRKYQDVARDCRSRLVALYFTIQCLVHAGFLVARKSDRWNEEYVHRLRISTHSLVMRGGVA